MVQFSSSPAGQRFLASIREGRGLKQSARDAGRSWCNGSRLPRPRRGDCRAIRCPLLVWQSLVLVWHSLALARSGLGAGVDDQLPDVTVGIAEAPHVRTVMVLGRPRD